MSKSKECKVSGDAILNFRVPRKLSEYVFSRSFHPKNRSAPLFVHVSLRISAKLVLKKKSSYRYLWYIWTPSLGGKGQQLLLHFTGITSNQCFVSDISLLNFLHGKFLSLKVVARLSQSLLFQLPPQHFSAIHCFCLSCKSALWNLS